MGLACELCEAEEGIRLDREFGRGEQGLALRWGAWVLALCGGLEET